MLRHDDQAYPRSQYAFALLYFTGNDHFNRSMRLYASKLGYTLTNHVQICLTWMCEIWIHIMCSNVGAGASTMCAQHESQESARGQVIRVPH